MEFEPTAIPDVILIKPKVFKDARGHFFESWTERKFAAAGLDLTFVQDNQNRSEQHVLRGLHYQLTKPQGKLVRVVTGAVFDVAVDMRRGSPTFLHWHGAVLSAANMTSLLVPQGFAHGFQTLGDECELLYLHSRPFAPSAEAGLNVHDPRLAIEWPLPFSEISARDAARALIAGDFAGISP